MRSLKIISFLFVLVLGAYGDQKSELLKAREAVWRAWFANDTKTLQKMVPAETIVISSSEEEWKDRTKVMAEAADFQREGGKLLKLEFPRTEVQWFGDVAVIYSKYALDLEVGGKQVHEAGRVTEIFVKRDGRWVNPGWHTDREK